MHGMIFAPRKSGYSMLLPTLLVTAAAIQAAIALNCYDCWHYTVKSESDNEVMKLAAEADSKPNPQCIQGIEDFAKNPSPSVVCPSTSKACRKVDVKFDTTMPLTGKVHVEMVARGCGDPSWGAQWDSCAWGNDYKGNVEHDYMKSRSISGDVSSWVCHCTRGDLCNTAPAAVTSSLVLMMSAVYAATKLA